jgi:5'-3' exonuclease
MGIYELNRWFRQKKIPCSKYCIQNFAGKTIALDFLSLAFKIYFRAKNISVNDYQSHTQILFNNFLLKWDPSTKLVFIIDNPVKNKAKDKTLQHRKEMDTKLHGEITVVESKLQTDPFNPSLLARYETLQKRNKDGFLPVFREMLKVLHSYEDKYKVITAKGEAEFTACKMVHRGKADFVLSNDSDCFAHLCPSIMIENFSGNAYRIYRIDEILQFLDILPLQFRDFCILLGTDYSERLLPPTTAHEAIVKYGSIEGIPGLDLSKIDLGYVRSQFVPCKYMKLSGIPGIPNGPIFPSGPVCPTEPKVCVISKPSPVPVECQ